MSDLAYDIEMEHHPTSTGVSNEKMAMWSYLASDALLFAGLISTYMMYKNRPGSHPDLAGNPIRPNENFDILFTSMTSFVLLMSSLTMVLAVTAVARGDIKRTRLWLLTTVVLGSTFIGGQVYEFTEFLSFGMGFTTNVATSAFYTLTGLHGVHVGIGIIMLLTLFGLTFVRKTKPESVEVIGLYWHFVDVVWVVIFTIVYLIP